MTNRMNGREQGVAVAYSLSVVSGMELVWGERLDLPLKH